MRRRASRAAGEPPSSRSQQTLSSGTWRRLVRGLARGLCAALARSFLAWRSLSRGFVRGLRVAAPSLRGLGPTSARACWRALSSRTWPRDGGGLASGGGHRVHSRGGNFCSMRCRLRRCSLSRRAASDTLPPQSASTRLMCSHLTRSSEGGSRSWSMSPRRAALRRARRRPGCRRRRRAFAGSTRRRAASRRWWWRCCRSR